MKLLDATKYRVESLNVEMPKSAPLVVHQDDFLFELENKRPKSRTGEMETRDNVKEEQVEKSSPFSLCQLLTPKAKDVMAENEEEKDVDEVEEQLLEGNQPNTGNEVSVFIKCEKIDKTLPDMNNKTKQGHFGEGPPKIEDMKEVKYLCGGCDYKFSEKDELEAHISNVHVNEEVRVVGIGCASCEDGEIHPNCEFYKRLKQSPPLRDSPQYSCDSCAFKSSKKKYIEQHTFAFHLKEVRYYCNICHYKSFYCENVIKHLKTHREQAGAKYVSIKCKQCQTQVIHDKNELCLNENIKTGYSCQLCDYTTLKRKYLREHKKVTHNEGLRYRCNQCEYKTRQGHQLKRHKKLVHKEDGEIVHSCPKCDYTTSKIIYMAKHTKLNHSKKYTMEDIIRCDHCEYETDTIISMKSHNKIVHKKNGLGYRSCSSCVYKTSKSIYMYKHTQLNHSENSLLQKDILHCKDCEYETITPRGMRNHTDMVHNKIVKFGCSLCPQKSFSIASIKLHMKRKHKDSKAKVISIDCKQCRNMTTHLECDVTQSQKKTLKRELSKKSKCPACDFISGNKTSMKKHKIIAHKNKVELTCKMCDYKSFSKNSVRLHMSLNHKSFPCAQCISKTDHEKCQTSGPIHWNQQCKFCDFNSHKTGLREHMKSSHPLEKLFECEKCDYKCNWLSNLNMHTRAKHEKLKMDCDKCNYSTTWKVALLYHRRLKHGIFQKNTKYKELLEFQETICEKCGFAGSSKMTMGLHNKSGCDRWM